MSEKQIASSEIELGKASLMPLIAKYAIPSIISMLVGALYNLTDQIFIGRIVGVVGNAASNVVFPTTTFSTAICMLLGIGTAAGFNIAQGAGKIEEAKKYVYTGLTVTAIIGFLTGLLVFIFRGQIIDLCGASPTGNVYPYAMQYLSIAAIGLPFYIFASARRTTDASKVHITGRLRWPLPLASSSSQCCSFSRKKSCRFSEQVRICILNLPRNTSRFT